MYYSCVFSSVLVARISIYLTSLPPSSARGKEIFLSGKKGEEEGGGEEGRKEGEREGREGEKKRREKIQS